MSDINELSAADISFLEPHLPARETARRRHDGNFIVAANEHEPTTNTTHNDTDQELPFVTLTYASSLDSMISLAPGLRTRLSGPETKSMTHYLRLHHDAILIGVGTAIPDDPSLSCRYPGATLDSQPQPVIIDPRRRWDVSRSKVAQLAAQGKCRVPWLVHVGPGGEVAEADCERVYIESDPVNNSPATTSSTIAWRAILRTLKQKGVNSVMIEGGATIISMLLSMPELVNSVIVTIAPTWLGQGGISVAPAGKKVAGDRVNSATLSGTAWRQFGADAVLCGSLQGSV